MLVNKAHTRQVFSFIDYLKGGMEINAFIAIDFTGMFFIITKRTEPEILGECFYLYDMQV